MMREVRQALEQIPNNNLDEVTAKGEDCINPKGSKTELQRSHKIFLNTIKVKTFKIVLAIKSELCITCNPGSRDVIFSG